MYKVLLFVATIIFSCQCFALKPVKKYEGIPDTMKLPYEKNTITA